MNHKRDYIAVDAMGGDFAPHAIIDGTLIAAQQGVAINLFGTNLQHFLDKADPDWKRLSIEIFETSQIISMSDEPVRAVRKNKDSSLVKAMQSVATGNSAAFFSAGNTGAALVAGIFILGKQSTIDRPALASFMPTFVKNKKVLCLDLGANVDCKPEYLVQFVELGTTYWCNQTGQTSPTVGLLSNGSEASKGNAATRQAYTLLQDTKLNFYGNIEPANILQGKVDIVVCDGFVGNVFVKTLESVAKMTGKAPKTNANIATLLGVNGIVFVGHGASFAQTIGHNLITAAKAIGKK